MRPHSTFAVLTLLVASAWPAAAIGQTETEKVHRVIPLAAGGTLNLKNFSGQVRITGADRLDVIIDAVRRAPKDRLERIKLDIQATASTITVEANKKDGTWWDRGKNNVVETEFDIQVPRRTRLDVSVFSSPVRITGVEGSHDVHGFSSDLVLTGVTGAVTAKTFSGDIDVEMTSAASTPALDLKTFSGDIDVRVAANARARVDFDSFSGDLSSDLPLMLQSKRRHKISAELGAADTRVEREAARNDLRFRTFSGDVRIKR